MVSVLENPNPGSIDDYVIRYWYKPEGPRHAAVRGAGNAGFTSVFYYDALQRPVAHYNPYVNIGLGYNPAGQITGRSVDNDNYAAPPEANRSLAYQVNGLNQYTAASNRTYTYDLNGNLTGDGTTSYVYDVENRLVSASGATNASLVYDPLGRLFQTSGGAAGTTQFLYDGDKMIAEYNGAGALLKRYVHGPGADEPVAEYDGAALGVAGRRYTLPDERGSVVGLINANGTSYWANRYDAWGTPGVNKGRFQYTGQAWIGELSMYYYKARIYSPTLGRFLQTDPIGYDDQINLYAYAGNDPLNVRDPTGMIQDDKTLAEQARAIAEKTANAIQDAKEMAADAKDLAENVAAIPDNIRTDALDAVVPDSLWQSSRAEQGISGDYSINPDFDSLPVVEKVVNSGMPHAVERAVEHGVFSDSKEARAAFTGLKASITEGGWPRGTIYDSAGNITRANSVLVPVGANGFGVYRVRANGTAVLQTTLKRR